MQFEPAGEILGPQQQIRSVVIKDDPRLPDGKYDFVDLYCTDSSCDCRKTILQVHHNDKLVSSVSYGWESPEFYRRWMGSADKFDKELASEMSGVSVDPFGPGLVSDVGIVILVKHLLTNDGGNWDSRIQSAYREIRKKLSDAR